MLFLSLLLALPILPPTPLQATPAAGDPLPMEVADIGPGTQGSNGVPRLRSIGTPLLEGPYHLDVVRGPSHAAGFIAPAISSSPLPIPELGGTIYVPEYLFLLPFTLKADGTSPQLLPLIVPPAWNGLELYAQAVLIDPATPGGVSLTNGLSIRFGEELGGHFLGRVYDGLGPDNWLTGVVSLDVDLDGDQDLARVNRLDDQDEAYVSFLLNDGYGRFELSPNTLDLHQFSGVCFCSNSSAPTLPFAADFTNDGIADLAFHCCLKDELLIVPLTGDQTFGTPVQLPIPNAFAYPSIDNADLDGDGDLDLVVNRFKYVAVFENLGNGNFVQMPDLPGQTGTYLYQSYALLGDLDQDSDIDLLISQPNPSIYGASLQSYINDGSGNFALGPLYQEDDPLSGNIEWTDVDMDGWLDLVSISTDRTSIELRLGSSDGFEDPVAFEVGTEPIEDINKIEVGDLTGNGRPDVLCSQDHSMTVLFGAPIEVFEETKQSIELGQDSHVLLTEHLDGEGGADILTSVSYGDDLAVYTELGNDYFRIDTTLERTGSGSQAPLFMDDLNDDGTPDLIAASQGVPSGLSVFLGQGKGRFGAEIFLPTSSAVLDFKTFDLGADGDQDLVVALNEHGGFNGLVSFENDGTGGFSEVASQALVNPLSAMAAGDINGDGTTDVALAVTSAATEVQLLINDGTGNLQIGSGVGAPAGQAQSLELSDVDGDGDLDLVQVGSFGTPPVREVRTYLGDGLGAFGPAISSPYQHTAARAAYGDLNTDGFPDVVTLSLALDRVYVHTGDGQGGFDITKQIFVNGQISHVALGDLNGNGHLDIILSGPYRYYVLPGAGDGTFAASQDYTVLTESGTLIAYDVTDDGVADLAFNREEDVFFQVSQLVE